MTSRITVAGAMRSVVLFSFAGVLAGGLLGCGGTSSTPAPPGSPANITGNWVFTANAGAGGIEPMSIFLTSNAGSVSGTAVLPPEPQICVVNGYCGGALTAMDPSITGTVDANGNLTLGSAVPGGSPVFTMTGTVSGATMSNGSFTLTGAIGTISQGTMTGIKYPPLDGAYSGTLTSQNTGQSFTMSAVLNQGSTPNSSGLLLLTGTVTVAGYSCVSSGGATLIGLSASYVGSSFYASLTPSSDETLFLTGLLSPDGNTLGVTYYFQSSGSCSLDSGTGNLSLQ